MVHCDPDIVSDFVKRIPDDFVLCIEFVVIDDLSRGSIVSMVPPRRGGIYVASGIGG